MLNLMNYHGEVKTFVQVFDNFVIMQNVKKDFFEKDIHQTIYYKHNDVAIMCGYYQNSVMIVNKEQLVKLVKENFDRYCNEMKRIIQECGIAKDIFKCDYKFITKLCDVTVEEHNKFIANYEDHQRKEESRLAKERHEKELADKKIEQEYIDEIIEKIKNDGKITGRELVDIANYKGFAIAPRTKGLILRCTNINSKDLNFEGKKPQSAGNVFKSYNQLKEILNETV